MSGIERFKAIADLVAALAPRPDPVTALYPSAGRDTMPFTFLGSAFLAHRGIDMPAPEVFVFIDHSEPNDVEDAALSFRDDRTEIRALDVREARVGDHPAWLMRVAVSDDGVEHEAGVARIRAWNTPAYWLCGGFTPDVFIGVRDGEGFGGQVPHGACENSLVLHTSPMTWFRSRPPRWWVTDHFRPAVRGLAEGDMVRSPDRDFPVAFRKVRLLSSQWGNITQLFGATVFEVAAVEKPPPPRRVYLRQGLGEDEEAFIQRFIAALLPEKLPDGDA